MLLHTKTALHERYAAHALFSSWKGLGVQQNKRKLEGNVKSNQVNSNYCSNWQQVTVVQEVTCSKPTTETPELVVTYVQSHSQRHFNDMILRNMFFQTNVMATSLIVHCQSSLACTVEQTKP